MARVKTFTNGGSVLPGDLNSIQDDYEGAFSQYRRLTRRGGVTTSAQAAATYCLPAEEVGLLYASTGGHQGTVFDFDPADYAAAPRTVKLRVRAFVLTNAVAPAADFTFGLYPVASWGGASGVNPVVTSLSAAVAGSTIAFAAPSASAFVGPSNSGDFTAPTAGKYVLGVVVSTGTAANSRALLAAELQVRQF